MKLNIEQMETGWFDLFVRLQSQDIDALIGNLLRMKNERTYFFSIQSNFKSHNPSISNLTFGFDQHDDESNAEMYPQSI